MELGCMLVTLCTHPDAPIFRVIGQCITQARRPRGAVHGTRPLRHIVHGVLDEDGFTAEGHRLRRVPAAANRDCSAETAADTWHNTPTASCILHYALSRIEAGRLSSE